MKEKEEVVSLLHPFNVGFYRKYGWELAFNRKKYSLPIENLKRDWKAAGYVRRNQDVKLLHDIYTDYAKSYNGMLVRDEAWWKQRVLTDQGAQVRVAYNSAGEPEAYLIYTVRKNILNVLDLAYRNNNGIQLIYEFLSNHDSMAEKIEMTVPENDLLPLMLHDPTFSQEIEPYFMARIIDVHAFLQMYPFINKDKTVKLEVTDEILPENNGCYVMKTNKTDVTKIQEKTNASISCSVQQLTALLLGFVRAPELWERGFIAGDKTAIHLLDEIIPQKTPYFADFF